MSEEIIQLEEGYARVFNDGIQPFLEFVENKECDFFKAKKFVTLYDLIFKMCIQRDPYNWSEQMYERYTRSIQNYLANTVRPALDAAANHKTYLDVAFLREWKTRWNNQKLIVKGLSKLFMYLDRFYTQQDGIHSLKEQGFKLYLENIFNVFAPIARTAILACIERERNGEEQDRHLLKESVNVFIEMGYNFGNKKLEIYRSELEKYIVESTGAYYKRQARIWNEQDSCANYLEKAERVLRTEKGRVDAYLSRPSWDGIHRECYTQLLKVHQLDVLKKKTGIFYLLDVNALDDLSRMHRLYRKFPEDLPPIAELCCEHIKKEGIEIVHQDKKGDEKKHTEYKGDGESKDEADDADEKREQNAESGSEGYAMVRNLIALHARYNNIIGDCFEKDQIFQKSLKKAFEDFINRDNKVSKLLAKYVGDVLKKGTKINVKDIEATLDNVVFLYGYIQEKDIFERDYQILLANRLLNGLCESEHNEKSMIARLKKECGYQWTNKLEGMFKDIQLSKDMMAKFKHMYARTIYSGDGDYIDLDVNVCTTGYWPASKSVPCRIPVELAPSCEKYKRFYLQQHSARKLDWRMDQGQAEIQVDFSSLMRRTLVVSTYQMMVFLIFNNEKIVSLKSILDITGLAKRDVANHLLSLAHPKVAVLLKRPNNRKLEESHQFMINPKYRSQLKKVIIPLLKATETSEQEDRASMKIIELQRRHQMDAAIVRIMKTRKRLKHGLLVAEVVSYLQARFIPKPTDIKRRIESLIEQDYLKRDEEDRGTYNYVA